MYNCNNRYVSNQTKLATLLLIRIASRNFTGKDKEGERIMNKEPVRCVIVIHTVWQTNSKRSSYSWELALLVQLHLLHHFYIQVYREDASGLIADLYSNWLIYDDQSQIDIDCTFYADK